MSKISGKLAIQFLKPTYEQLEAKLKASEDKVDDLEEDVTRLGLVNTTLTGVIDRIRGGKR